jgi:iron(III) transport system permease protein
MFSVPTLSSGIYKTWVSLFSLESAAFLGLVFFLFVLPFVLAEFFVLRSGPKPLGFEPKSLKWKPIYWLHLGLPLLVYLLLAVLLPILLLLKIVWFHAAESFLANVWIYTMNTALIGVAVASFVSGCSLGVAALLRWRSADKDVRFVDLCVSLGYGMPGILIGIGVFGLMTKGAMLFSFHDGTESVWPKVWALGGVIFGLSIRFAAPAWKLMERTLLQLPKQLDQAALVHGRGPWFLLRKLYIPFLAPSLWFGFALVLVEVMKELPVTLLLRPVGFDTLAVKVFEFTSEGEWEKAAMPILLISGLSVFGFSLKWFFENVKPGEKGDQ